MRCCIQCKNITDIGYMDKICYSDLKLSPQKDSSSNLFLCLWTQPCHARPQLSVRAASSTLTLWVQPVRVFMRHAQCVSARSRDNTRAHPLSRQWTWPTMLYPHSRRPPLCRGQEAPPADPLPPHIYSHRKFPKLACVHKLNKFTSMLPVTHTVNLSCNVVYF